MFMESEKAIQELKKAREFTYFSLILLNQRS